VKFKGELIFVYIPEPNNLEYHLDFLKNKSPHSIVIKKKDPKSGSYVEETLSAEFDRIESTEDVVDIDLQKFIGKIFSSILYDDKKERRRKKKDF